MHHDEANQAVKFGALLERGEYRYDAHDHHGPTLYYLTLPAAWLRGQHTLASLDERHAPRRDRRRSARRRSCCCRCWRPAIGRTAVAAGALLMALSPAMVFYSRMFIQESLFACFTLAFVIAHRPRGRRAAAWRGPLLAGRRGGPGGRDEGDVGHRAARRARRRARSRGGRSDRPAPRHRGRPRDRQRRALVSLASQRRRSRRSSTRRFSPRPGGVLEPFRGAGTYLDRGIDPGQPRAPVALLPRPARVLVVRRPEVERRAGARAGASPAR